MLRRSLFCVGAALGALLPVSLWAEVSPTKAPFDLTAADVFYNAPSQTLVASGSVVLTNAESRITADTVDYHTSAGLVSAYGNVTLLDQTTSNTLKVESISLTTNLLGGAATDLRMGVPVLGDIAHAQSAEISGTAETGRHITMRNVVYSPCQTCEGEAKPWTIKANKVVYDQSASTLTYTNPSLQVYDQTVLVLPWFRNPIGPQKPADGLLPTMFARSTQMGEEMTLSGYHFSQAENADYTLRNRLMSRRGDQISLERRQTTLTDDNELRLSYLNDDETGKVRSHAALQAEHDFDIGRRIGINGEVASDDTYLQQFYHRLDPYLASTAFAEDASLQHYYALSVTQFQDLNTTHSPANTAQVMPHLEMERWMDLAGGQLTLNGDMVNITRGQGVESRRMVGQADYSRPWLLEDGSKITLGALGRMDLYNVTGATTGSGNGAITRALPQATLDWEKPYVSPDGTHTIAPRTMLVWSPRGGNANTKIPNEDSVAYELDTANLFEPNRFAGLDRLETGPRLIYGLDNRWGTPDATRWRVFLGQSFRRFSDSSLPASGGAQTNASDWVGQLEATPNEMLSFSNNFRLDNATFIPRRVDTALRVGAEKRTNVQFTHTYLDGGPHELDGKLTAPLNDHWAFRAEGRNDLANSHWLHAQAALAWKRDCYQIEFMTRRRGYSNSDLHPSTDYIVNIQLLTLGSTGKDDAFADDEGGF